MKLVSYLFFFLCTKNAQQLHASLCCQPELIKWVREKSYSMTLHTHSFFFPLKCWCCKISDSSACSCRSTKHSVVYSCHGLNHRTVILQCDTDKLWNKYLANCVIECSISKKKQLYHSKYNHLNQHNQHLNFAVFSQLKFGSSFFAISR